MNTRSFVSRYEMQIYSIFRLVAGFLFLWHGSQKLFSFPPAGQAIPTYIVFIASCFCSSQPGVPVYSASIIFWRREDKNKGKHYEIQTRQWA
jgi:uncharacterized membrane protein YphA (DoxX/SURF4 family)